jgi:hypothetical protein
MRDLPSDTVTSASGQEAADVPVGYLAKLPTSGRYAAGRAHDVVIVAIMSVSPSSTTPTGAAALG